MKKWNRIHLLQHDVQPHHRYVAFQGDAPLGFGATVKEALDDAAEEYRKNIGSDSAEFEVAEIIEEE